MKTEQEIKLLVKEVYENTVFLATSKEAFDCAFSMILLFATKDTFPEDTVALYEYNSKAGPRSMNGYPMFMSCGYLTKDEWEIFSQYYEQYKDLVGSWESK